MEVLLEIDRQVFLFINNWGHQLFDNEMNFVTPFLDILMLFFSKIGNGAMVWFALGLLLAFLGKKKSFKSVIAFLWPLFLAMVLSVLLVNLTLKPLIGRMRPNFIIPQTALLGSIHYDFSFPSGHAASSFAAAYVLVNMLIGSNLGIRKRSAVADETLIAKRRRLRFGLYFLAALIAFSRIYIGVHYPSDVIAGAILGVMIGKISIWVDRRVTK